jgi:hypothetical protein
LLNGVNQRHALLMFILLLVSIPIAFLNELNSVAAITLARGADFLSVFDQPQRIALARLFLNLRGAGFDVAGIFWGLWLYPLGLLVYRSGFIPRILGFLLNGRLLCLPGQQLYVVGVAAIRGCCRTMDESIQLVEMVFMLWLLIIGAKPKPLPE